MRRLIYLAFVAVMLFFYSKCGQRGQYPGKEYMPDMAHPVTYEAQLSDNYYWNHYGTEESYRKFASAHMPATGTIARGHSLFHYVNTEEDRLRAEAEITKNPVKIDMKDFEKAKQLYNVYCGVCHGDKGDGNGPLYNGGDGPYPAKPASYVDGPLLTSSLGRYYFAIMYGKNTMGSYKDKLDEHERWMVLHYIDYLRAQATYKPASIDEFIKIANGEKSAPSIAQKVEEPKK